MTTFLATLLFVLLSLPVGEQMEVTGIDPVQPVVVQVVHSGTQVGIGSGEDVRLYHEPTATILWGKTTIDSTVSFLPLQSGLHRLRAVIPGYVCTESLVFIHRGSIESPDNFTISCAVPIRSSVPVIWLPILEMG